MAHLTQDELATVEANPVGSSLDEVRQALRDAESEVTNASSDDSPNTPGRPRLFLAALGKLFSILSESDVTLMLASRTGRDVLLCDLTIVRIRLQKGDIDYNLFHPLSQLVIKKAPAVDIWTSVVAVVLVISNTAPPPNLAASFGTPVTHSSVSQQGLEQTRRNLEEIRYCTHRAVGGFHKKNISKTKDGPDELDESGKVPVATTARRMRDGVDSLVRLQKTRCANGILISKRSCWQAKVKLKTGTESNATHIWEDVLVVGELKESDQKTNGLWLHIASSVRNVFATQPRRRFVHAFTLTGSEMENWVFDRSGPYSGTVFDIHKDPEKFIQVLCGYLMMTDDKLGLDTFCVEKEDKAFVTLPAEPRGKKQKLELRPHSNLSSEGHSLPWHLLFSCETYRREGLQQCGQILVDV
ncbi:hypothetical protein ED733_004096 [Metarhizium rileyi]|uniref:Fungal-type protein kinase domain-containing protein n=1 Tax=Metarhizium rileyi (strain RCEF 4871) TaxID=1649241 RepID=A0A5C6G533_METRR|nr:hypothetical protein ED733_004096 [Metarhizium rileyi]